MEFNDLSTELKVLPEICLFFFGGGEWGGASFVSKCLYCDLKIRKDRIDIDQETE